MKKYLIFALILLSSQLIFAQNFVAVFKAGYCTFSLAQIKSFQKDLLEQTVFADKAVVSFPNNYAFSTNFEARIDDQNSVGFCFTYFSSGGRNHIKDYSGEYKLDMPLLGYRLGLIYKGVKKNNDRVSYYGQLQLGYIISKLEIDNSLVLSNGIIVYSESTTIKSRSPFVEPTVGALVKIKNYLSLDFGIGYEIDFAKKTGSDIGILKDVNIDWSGFRMMLGVNVQI